MVRKFLTGLFITIIVLVVVVPLLMGALVASEFKKHISQLNYPGAKVQLINYKMGWFSSRAVLQVDQQVPATMRRLKIFNNPLPDHFTYLAKLHIYHGPVALVTTLNHHRHLFWGQAAMSGQLQLINPQVSMMTGLQGLNEPAKLCALLSFMGKLHVHLQHDAIKYINVNQGVMLNIGSMLSEITFDRTLSTKMVGNVQVQGLQFAYKAFAFYMAPYATNFTYHKDGQNIWQGQSQLQASQIIIVNNNQTVAKLTGVDYLASRSVVANKLSGSQLININNMQILNNNFSQVQLNLILQNVNFKALPKLRALLTQSATKANQQEMLIQFLPVLFAGARYQLQNLQAQTPIGLIKLSGYWQFAKNIPKINSAKERLQQFLRAGMGVLNVNLPVQQQQTALAAGIISGPGPVLPAGTIMPNTQVNYINFILSSANNKGYFVEKNGRWLAKIEYKNGMLKINKFN